MWNLYIVRRSGSSNDFSIVRTLPSSYSTVAESPSMLITVTSELIISGRISRHWSPKKQFTIFLVLSCFQNPKILMRGGGVPEFPWSPFVFDSPFFSCTRAFFPTSNYSSDSCNNQIYIPSLRPSISRKIHTLDLCWPRPTLFGCYCTFTKN